MKLEIVTGNNLPIESDFCIVIDVLRASSVHYALFSKGAKRVYLAETKEHALELKQQFPEAITVGEKDGYKLEGFDFGNSPEDILAHSGNLQTIIHKTTNGTRALLAARKSENVFSVGLNGSPSLIQFLKQNVNEDQSVTLVATHPTSDDDKAVADYLAGELNETPLDFQGVIDRIYASEGAQKFQDAENTAFSEEDLALCTRKTDDSFLMQLKSEGPLYFLERIDQC